MSATRRTTGNLRVSRRCQHGVALVETAITLALFLMLVFAILEFSMAYFAWARTNEAARDGLRQAIVSNPVANISGVSCPGWETEVACTGADCATLLAAVQRVAPFVSGEQVFVGYACGDAGNPARTGELMIPEVTVEIRNVQYEFIVPVLLGVDTPMTLPPARAARTGEDLFTEGSGG